MHRSWALLDRYPRWVAYALAGALTLVTLGLRLATGADHSPLIVVFLLPIVATGFLAGMGPALAATALSVLASDALLLPVQGANGIRASVDQSHLFWLACSGMAIALISGAFHRARREAEAARRAQDSARERLREEHDRLSAAFHDSPVSTAILRVGNGCIVECNEAFVQLHGYTREEVAAGRVRATDLFATPAEFEAIQARLVAQESLHGEFIRFRRKDGSTGEGLFSLRAIALGGEPHVIGLLSDVTESRRLARDIREIEARQSVLYRSSPLAIMLSRLRDGVLVDCNDAALRFGGVERSSILGKTAIALGVWTSGERALMVERLLRDGSIRDHEMRYTRPDGARLDLLYFAELVEIQGERCIMSTFVDITERKRLERTVHDHQLHLEQMVEDRTQALSLAASVFREAAEAIFITDPRTTIVDVNAAFTQVTGFTREDAVGRTPNLLHSGHQDASFYERMWKAIAATGHWHGEIWNRRKDGALFACRSTITAVKDASGELTHYIGLFSDITERRLEMEAIEHQAHFDALTQLPNRLLLEDRMKQAFARARRQSDRVAVCFLDLDRFKPVNDEHGHKMGDHLLVEVAHRLQACVRVNDTVARVGGDEFVLLLTDLGTGEEWREVLERVLGAVAEPCPLPAGRWARVTASIGVTFFPQDDGSPDLLLRHADEAMYLAKHRMPGTFVTFREVVARSAI